LPSPSDPSILRSSLFSLTHTPPTHIYTLSLHDALPIWTTFARSRTFRSPGSCSTTSRPCWRTRSPGARRSSASPRRCAPRVRTRSEEHTSELQSLTNLVCRLLLEKKKNSQLITALSEQH